MFARRRPRRLALAASAAPINLARAGEAQRLARRSQPWQDEAWTYADAVPQIGYGIRWHRQAAGQLRLIAAVATADAEEPVDVHAAEGNSAVPASIADAATDALARLSSDTFLWADLLEPMAECLQVPGEGVLIVRDVGGHEVAEFRSADSVDTRRDGSVWLLDAPDDGGRKGASGGEQLPPEALVSRMWTPSARWPALADSPMKQLVLGGDCEVVLLHNRTVQNTSRGRISGNGLLALHDSADLLVQQPDGSYLPDVSGSRMMAELQRALLEPIGDPTAPGAIVPALLRFSGERSVKDVLQHVTLDRPFDDKLSAAAERSLRNIVEGLDLPAEMLTGFGDSNHWSAWAITDEAFRSHIKPLAIRMCAALTAGYLRRVLPEYGVPEEWARRLVVWFDPSLLVTKPNRGPEALELFDRKLLAAATTVEAHGFDPLTDMPDPEELAERAPAVPAPLLPEEGGEPTTPQPTDGTPTTSRESLARAASARLHLVASARPRVEESRRLTAIDRRLRGRVAAAAQAAVDAAVADANARVRLRVPVAERAAVVASGAAALGEARVAALGVDLFRGAWAAVAEVFLDEAASALDDSLRVAASIAGVDLSARGPAARVAEVAARAVGLRAAGARFLVDGLEAHAMDRLYDRPLDAQGEADPGEVPFSIVRGAVALAGGLPVTSPGLADDGTRVDRGYVSGVGTGELVAGFLRDAGSEVTGYEWVYGISVRHFEPHRRLDGAKFTDLDDPRLVNDGWPAPILAPGDHKGCHCDLALIWSDGVSSADELDAIEDATADGSWLAMQRELAALDEAAGRYGYGSTSATDAVAEADRIANARPSRRRGA